MITVLDPGLSATLQDGGRPGLARYGVSECGAFDRYSWVQANALAGNVTEPRTAIEALMGGIRLRALSRVWLGVAGAHSQAMITTSSGEVLTMELAGRVILEVGDEIHLNRLKVGLRTYVAAHGGFTASQTLGSSSWDATARIGPPPLAADQTLATEADQPASGGSDPTQGFSDANLHSLRGAHGIARLESFEEPICLHSWRGPHFDLLAAASRTLLTTQPWVVSPDSNRIGIRLTGEKALSLKSQAASLPSAPTIPGVIQALPAGGLVIFGPDAPTTGGYPVIGVLPRDQLDILAQARPGRSVRLGFEPSS